MKYKDWLTEQFKKTYEKMNDGINQKDLALMNKSYNLLKRLSKEFLRLGYGEISENQLTLHVSEIEWKIDMSELLPIETMDNNQIILNDKIVGLQNDIEYLKEENQRLKAGVVPVTNTDDESSLVASLMERNKELQRLAYTDIKTDTLNSNAFNRDFVQTSFASRLALVGIMGMKSINLTFGKSAGDKVIKNVARFLSANFKGCVYRIIGDQFAIIETKRSFEELSASLKQIRIELEKLDIHIAYGVCDGSECTSGKKKEMIDKAESRMDNMKCGEEPMTFLPPNVNTDSTDSSVQHNSGLQEMKIELTEEELLANKLNQEG